MVLQITMSSVGACYLSLLSMVDKVGVMLMPPHPHLHPKKSSSCVILGRRPDAGYVFQSIESKEHSVSKVIFLLSSFFALVVIRRA